MAKYNFELKKKIVLEHLSLGVGSKALAKKYNVKSASVAWRTIASVKSCKA